MYKRLLVCIVSISLTMCIVSPSILAEKTIYSDYEVENDAAFADSVGLMGGYEDGSFRPNNPITRAEFTKSIMQAAQIAYPDIKPASIHFNDFNESHWAYDDVAKAVSLDIISGFEDGTFRPNDNVTYEQAVTMIFNLLGYKPVAELYGGFPHAYISLAYYNRYFSANIPERNGLLEMDEIKQKEAITRRDALVLLSSSLLTPMCIITDYETSWDGSQTPIYSIGGNGEIVQTLYTMKNVTYSEVND